VLAARRPSIPPVQCMTAVSGTSNLSVIVLDALSDNYMYLIVDGSTKKAAVVDPADAGVAAAAAQAAGAEIAYVLTTHHHFDHAGGNAEMCKLVPGIQVVGGDSSIQAMTMKVTDGQALNLGALQVQCVHTPAHTSGHMSYLVKDTSSADAPMAIFTGDALFVGGCGRFFEGGPEQMLEGVAKLGGLPPTTQLFCGHEYTIKNLQFALHVEPHNKDAETKILWAQERRAAQEPTVPSTIGEELSFNPFMRVGEPTVQQHVGGGSNVDVMRKLRNAKDGFAGSSRPWIPGGGPLPGL